jgi:uncharacterized low-complexity protein
MLSGPLDNLAQKLSGMGSIGTDRQWGAVEASARLSRPSGSGWVCWARPTRPPQQQIDTWAHALLDGGNAAAQAQAQMAQATSFATTFGSGIMSAWSATSPATRGRCNGGRCGSKQTADAAKELYDAMSPLQQKQQDVTKATNDLELAIEKYGPDSGQAPARRSS